jgi:Icc-related predicted phosphoesterase
MPLCYFISDLHGKQELYQALFRRIREVPPDALFIGGDLLPHGYYHSDHSGDFISTVLKEGFLQLRRELKSRYPRVFVILGNDDPRINEQRIDALGQEYQLWEYMHNRKVTFEDYTIYGYSFIPPSPFGLKDWEKYDVSRFADPGCTHPGEGMRTIPPDYDPQYDNISQDLEKLGGDEALDRAIFLFHSPPYNTPLDRAALDGMMVDYVPLDVHVGSIAIQRFIEHRQPRITLHGHVHEASRLTGAWSSSKGNTRMLNAAWDGSGLALVQFDPADPDSAVRTVIETS